MKAADGRIIGIFVLRKIDDLVDAPVFFRCLSLRYCRDYASYLLNRYLRKREKFFFDSHIASGIFVMEMKEDKTVCVWWFCLITRDNIQ
jgi:hypothetical protein